MLNKFIAIIIAFGLLFPFPKWADPLISEPISNLLHLPIGFVGTIIILEFFGKNNDKFRIQPPVAGALALSLSLLFEVLQQATGRNGSFIDVFISFWGILAAVFWFDRSPKLKIWHWKVFIPVFLSLVIGLIISIPPIFAGFKLYQERELMFPVLLAQNSSLAALTSPIENSDARLQNKGECIIEIKSTAGKWSGIELEAGDKDWSSYKILSVYLENFSTDGLLILLRIDDSGDSSESHSRFGKFIHLESFEKKNVLIPVSKIISEVKGRIFNINEVRRIVIASDKDQSERKYCVGEIRLIP
ncbi:MAG TPA: hypothetical protein PKA63_13270 [Oligoflexia bacterium]|nr:hypothetical protein [Oligoflexia bacterium]HMP49631.1 hypothetical protein [Oligoflexia bacterium]